jgi:hypothetical protein
MEAAVCTHEELSVLAATAGHYLSGGRPEKVVVGGPGIYTSLLRVGTSTLRTAGPYRLAESFMSIAALPACSRAAGQLAGFGELPGDLG